MWINTLRQWTQTMYGLIHSVKLSSDINMGNINRINESINESLQWCTDAKQFSSNVEERNLNDQRIRMDDNDVEGISENLKKRLLELLIVDLASLTDELLCEILSIHGKLPEDYRYLRDKVKLVSCSNDTKWAQKGVLELNALRNCIVHNEARWNDGAFNEINDLCNSGVLAQIGDPVALSYEDIFRYKRAVRTLLNQASQNGFI